MQMSAMKACFQIAECSLSSAKIRTFSERAYTWFSEDITIIGDLLSFVLKYFNHILVATYELATFIQHISIDETAFFHDSS